jgi:DNA-binding winged helix-turn-helix (wHTH) protein
MSYTVVESDGIVAAPIQSPHSFRFGPFEADPETGELRKSGRKLRLQEKPFQVLIALLERRGNLVSRKALHQRLWPGDTFVDFENGLNAAISKLKPAKMLHGRRLLPDRRFSEDLQPRN